MTPSQELREAIARIVDPTAFMSHAAMYAYCLRQGDGEETALRYANDTHLPSMEKARGTADAILSLIPSDRDDPSTGVANLLPGEGV